MLLSGSILLPTGCGKTPVLQPFLLFLVLRRQDPSILPPLAYLQWPVSDGMGGKEPSEQLSSQTLGGAGALNGIGSAQPSHLVACCSGAAS